MSGNKLALQTMENPASGKANGSRNGLFTRSQRKGRSPKGRDEKGTIQLRIVRKLEGTPNHTKGNITRTMSVTNAKVSQVAKAVERALFGESA